MTINFQKDQIWPRQYVVGHEDGLGMQCKATTMVGSGQWLSHSQHGLLFDSTINHLNIIRQNKFFLRWQGCISN